MIKTNSELPKCMLWSDNCGLNMYEFVLFHLYREDEEYREYFKTIRRDHPGRLMILDNSQYEYFIKGESPDIEAYKKAIDDLVPDMYILPDVLMDMANTIKCTREFLSNPPSNKASRPLAVIQGNTFEELNQCIQLYKFMGLDHIAVPFHNVCFYNEGRKGMYGKTGAFKKLTHHKTLTADDRYALGRIKFIYKYGNDLAGFKHVHLLGSHNPIEKKFYTDFHFIKTMDTGYPTKLGVQGVALGDEKSKPDILIDDFFHKDLDSETRQLIRDNIRTFRDY